MPGDPTIPMMTLEDAIKSVLVISPEELVSKEIIKILGLLTVAAAQPTAVPQNHIAFVAEWALWTRAQNMLLELVLAKRMTVFPQPDGSLKFGGGLMTVAAAAAKLAEAEQKKLILPPGAK